VSLFYGFTGITIEKQPDDGEGGEAEQTARIGEPLAAGA